MPQRSTQRWGTAHAAASRRPTPADLPCARCHSHSIGWRSGNHSWTCWTVRGPATPSEAKALPGMVPFTPLKATAAIEGFNTPWIASTPATVPVPCRTAPFVHSPGDHHFPERLVVLHQSMSLCHLRHRKHSFHDRAERRRVLDALVEERDHALGKFAHERNPLFHRAGPHHRADNLDALAQNGPEVDISSPAACEMAEHHEAPARREHCQIVVE